MTASVGMADDQAQATDQAKQSSDNQNASAGQAPAQEAAHAPSADAQAPSAQDQAPSQPSDRPLGSFVRAYAGGSQTRDKVGGDKTSGGFRIGGEGKAVITDSYSAEIGASIGHASDRNLGEAKTDFNIDVKARNNKTLGWQAGFSEHENEYVHINTALNGGGALNLFDGHVRAAGLGEAGNFESRAGLSSASYQGGKLTGEINAGKRFQLRGSAGAYTVTNGVQHYNNEGSNEYGRGSYKNYSVDVNSQIKGPWGVTAKYTGENTSYSIQGVDTKTITPMKLGGNELFVGVTWGAWDQGSKKKDSTPSGATGGGTQ
jgi:hypothetical protein